MGGSTLKAKVHEEMTAALKAGDKLRLGALRMLAAAITNREKDVLHELSDDEVREVAAREVKRRTESVEASEELGRVSQQDLLGEADVDALIEEAISTTGATSVKELGKVMGVVMAKAKGRVDGAVVQAKVRARLERED